MSQLIDQSLYDQLIILEIKQGPYNPDFAAVFADWAPEEPESALFLQWLHHAETGASFR